MSDITRIRTRSRAFRRFMRKIKISKRLALRNRYYSYVFGNKDRTPPGALAKTGTSCSCVMCGNPRKHFDGKRKSESTRQELVADILTKEFSSEFGVFVKAQLSLKINKNAGLEPDYRQFQGYIFLFDSNPDLFFWFSGVMLKNVHAGFFVLSFN